MKTSNLIEILENISPAKRAAKWDNPGLLVGGDKDVRKVVLAVDASDYVIDTAINQGADMIITHHPLIFGGIKNVTDSDFIGRRVLKLAANGISLYAMHTNFDVTHLSIAAGVRLGIEKEGILGKTGTINLSDGSEDEIGYGLYGRIENADTVAKVAALTKEVFNIKQVRVFGNLQKKVNKVAVFPGSGKSALDEAAEAGVDVIITGDIDHHAGTDAVAKGLCVIDAGHYGIEKIFPGILGGWLKDSGLELDIIQISDDEPFVTV